MNTHNTACFRHLKGNCTCKDIMNLSIGTRLRTPKANDKKRWRDFAIYLCNGEYWKKELTEKGIIKHLGITDKMLTGRSTYKNYSEHRQSVTRVNHDKSNYSYDKTINKIAIQLSNVEKLIAEYPNIEKDGSKWYKEHIKQYKDNKKRKEQGRKYVEPKPYSYNSPEQKKAWLEQKIRETPDVFRKDNEK